MKYYLVGCGKAKRAEAAPAGDLYTGSLFRAARRYVASQPAPRAWAVLSAKHGLVLPHAVIEPYEQRMPTSKLGRLRWTNSVWAQLERELGRAGACADELQVELLAGEAYTSELRAWLEARAVRVTEPLQGLTLGQRLSWFKQRSKGS